MKLKSLLFMVTLLLTCLGVRADEKVVFEQHFDSEQTADPSAVGFYEFINDQAGDEREVNDGALVLSNSDQFLCKTERWQRAVKFRNLPLEEGKTYRLSFLLKGSKTYNDGETDVNCKLSTLLMQGEDNADISLLDYDGAEQRLEAEDFNDQEFKRYSKKFVFASEDAQRTKYAEQGKGELANKFFLTLSVYNPGVFFIDDVVLTEAGVVQSSEFGTMGAIKIDFGKNTNIAAMAEAAPKGLVMFGDDDLQCASVEVNGEDAEIEAIEYHKDGCLYIFLVEPVEATDKIVVNFTNPTDEKQIKFTDKESEASAFDVSNFEATYNAGLDDVLSFLYLSPELMSSYPANKAFAIDKDLNEFTFVFDHEVVTSEITAILECGDTEVPLTLKEGTEKLAEEVVFVRSDNGLLAKNNKITLSNVITDNVEIPSEFVINFEAGKPKIAKEVITPVQTIDFKAAAINTIPLGWTLYNNYVSEEEKGDVRASGSSQGSGPRILFAEGFYVRSSESKESRAFYGDLEGYAVTLPVGTLHIDFIASGYKASGQKVLCEVLDATGANVLASKEVNLETVTPDGGPVKSENMQKITVEYNNAVEQNAILRYTVFSTGGMIETILTSVVVNTYERTEGDIPDDKEIINETFAAYDNVTPAAESGWFVYDGGNRLSPSAGGGSRILGCNGTPIKKAYFCRNFGGNMSGEPGTYMTYGEEGSGKTLSLQAGTEYEMTYYAATWNDEGGEIGGFSQVAYAIIDPDGQVVSTATKNLSKEANAHNNGSTAFVADKFEYSFTPSKSGNYVLKFWGSNCTLACGNITFIQPGSRAVKYYAELATAVDNAKAILAKCDSVYYDGTTKTALTEAIAKYEDPDKITMTTEEEFKAAIAELQGLTKSMETRFEYIPRFNTAYAAASEVYTSAIGTKYENLECYEILEDVIATYEGVDPSTLEDEDLVGATTTMENNTTLFKNMRDVCVGLLTKQIAGLAAQLVALDETKVADEYVLAAGNAITDDQEIAKELKLRITKAIYDKCAEGDPFNREQVDDEGMPTGIMEPVEIDATNFIQNAGFYSTGAWPATVTDFPGWTIEPIAGRFGPSYGTASWGGERATALKPVVEASIRTDWGTHEYDAKQLIDAIPVVKCTVSIIVGEDGTEPHEAYGYIGEGDAQVKKYYDGQTPGEEKNEYSRDTNIPREFTDVTPNVDEENILGSILLGAHARVNAAFARVDNAVLKLTGKVEGFDYADAAKKLASQITAIEKVQQAGEPAEAPVKVVYYDLNGVATSAPQGIAIKVATYANGYVKVSKVIVK